MKHVNLYFILLALLLSSTANATGPRVSPSLISTASDIYTIKLPPFVDPGNQYACYLGEVVYSVLHEQKIDAVLTGLPLQSMVKYYLLNDNALGALSPYLHLTVSQKKDLIIIPIDTVNESYYYYKPNHPDGLAWKGKLKRLSGLRFGTIKGDVVEKYKQAGIKIKLSRIDVLIKKLVVNEVDFVRLPDLTVAWYVGKQFADQKDNFIKMPTPAGNLPLAIMFNKKHPQGQINADKFKQGLDKLKSGGQFQQIQLQYIN